MRRELRAVLRDAPAVSALCGVRCDWGKRPQGDPLPGISLHLISGSQVNTLNGVADLFQGSVQVDCWGRDYMDALDLAGAVKAVLNGYRQDGFRGVFLEAERDSTERGSNEAERPDRVSLDFFVNWRNSNV